MSLTKLDFSSFSGLFPSPALIGFDLGMEKLNMVQVEFIAGKPVISSASSDYCNSDYATLLEQPELLKNLVKSSFKKNGFKGRKVVASVPTSLLKILFLNFQCKPHEVESQVLLKALEIRTRDILSDYVIDYIPINPHGSEQVNRMALVAMAKQDDVENYLDLLASCGLTVEALEIGPLAIKRLVSSFTTAKDIQKVLVINFGIKKSYLTVVWHNELLLDREIDFGMDTILQAIAKAFDTTTQTALEILHSYGLAEHENDLDGLTFDDLTFDEDEASIKNVLIDILSPSFMSLAEEIKDVLIYVASETRGGAVELIYLMGSLTRVAEVDQIIDQLISIPVQTINPFYGLEVDNKTLHDDDLGPLAGIAVATGLSMRGNI